MDVTDSDISDTLTGTATYVGGAAGQYSLYIPSTSMGDAGGFTARVKLRANFTTTGTDKITGTIDQFMGTYVRKCPRVQKPLQH